MESKALESLKENFGTIEDYQTLVREIERLRNQNINLKQNLKYAMRYKKLLFRCVKFMGYIKNLVVYKAASDQAKEILDLFYQLKNEKHDERNLKPSNSGELKSKELLVDFVYKKINPIYEMDTGSTFDSEIVDDYLNGH